MSMLKSQENKLTNSIKAILATLEEADGKHILKRVSKELYRSGSSPVMGRRRLSKLQQDPELLAYIISLPLEHMTQIEVQGMCIDRFGLGRSPKRNSLSRAWSWLECQRKKKLHDGNLTISQFNRVKAEFIARGTTITEWSKKNNVTVQNIRAAMIGSWSGPKARELRNLVLAAANLTLEDLVND